MRKTAVIVLLVICFLSQSCYTQTPAIQSAATRPSVIETEGIKITLPTQVNLWCGWRIEVPVKIENLSAASREVVVSVRPPVNIFINGQTNSLGRENASIEVLRITLQNGETRQATLELQSLRVGQYLIPVICCGKEANLWISSQVIQRGAYFMYRCWFESSEFFYPVWSNGLEELNPIQKKDKIREIGRGILRSGVSKAEAEREANQQIFLEYKPSGYKSTPNWQEAFDHKKNQHTETYGFQYVDIDGLGWNVERVKGQYDWTLGDFMIKLWADNFQAEPFVRIEIPPEWAPYEQSPTGIRGFYDPQNLILMEHWGKFCEALAERYDGDGQDDAPGSPVIKCFILANEPEGYWLNVDFDRAGWPIERSEIFDTDWWKNAQSQGNWARAYALRFGDMIFETTKMAAQSIHRANSAARVATPQFGARGPASHEMFNYLLSHGLGEYVDAWGLHPGNGLRGFWQSNPQAMWWLEDATNQAPPFMSEDLERVEGALDRRGQTLHTIKPVDEVRRENPYMGKLWRKLIDESFSRPLEDLLGLQAKYSVDLPIWVTEELTIGPLATNRRENLIAALREYTIVFHQKVETTVLAGYISANMFTAGAKIDYLPDSTARDLIVDVGSAIAGAKPVVKFDSQWFAPDEGQNLDYRWVVTKLFNRGDEDILAVWSNSAKDETLKFELAPEVHLRNVRMTKFDADAIQFRKIEFLKELPQQIVIKPLTEFYFISVISDSPKFAWLENLRRQVSSEEEALMTRYRNTTDAVSRAKQNLRGHRIEDAGKYRAVPRMLDAAQDAIIMGSFDQAQQTLNEINDLLNRL